MARTFATVEELNLHRAERERLFQQAVAMHEKGELTDEEFAMVERKHIKRLRRLDRMKKELFGRTTGVPVSDTGEDALACDPTGNAAQVAADAVRGSAPSVEPAPPSMGHPVVIAQDDIDSDVPKAPWEQAPRTNPMPSERDIEILSALRSAPETVTTPRANEIRVSEPDTAEAGELEEIRELYGRELYAKEQLAKRLESESKAKRELSASVLELTRHKDELNLKLSETRKSRSAWKKRTLLLFVVCCAITALACMLFRDAAGAKKLAQNRSADFAAADKRLKAVEVECQTFEQQVELLRNERNSLSVKLKESKLELGEKDREIARLRKSLAELKAQKGGGSRKNDRLVIDYALLLLDKPDVDSDELLSRLAASYGKDKEQVREILNDYTSAPRDHFSKGLAAVLQGRADESAAQLERAALDEQVTVARLLLLTTRLLKNDSSKKDLACRLLEKSLLLDPGADNTRFELASHLLAGGRAKEALVHLLVLVKSAASPAGVVELGTLVERKGFAAEAGEIYRAGLKKFPSSRVLLTALASIEMQSARFREAVELLEQALAGGARGSEAATIHFNLVPACLGAGLLDKAREHCSKAAELGLDVTELKTILSAYGK